MIKLLNNIKFLFNFVRFNKGVLNLIFAFTLTLYFTLNASAQYTTALSNGTSPVAASTNCLSAATTITIQAFNLSTSGSSGTNHAITGISFPVSGSYACSDISYYQIWYNTSNSLSGATQYGSNITCPGTGSQTPSTTGSLTLTVSTTYYFFITMNVVASPANGDYLTVGALGTTNITTTNTISGSAAAAGQQTLYQSPVAPTGVTASPSTICPSVSTNLNATSTGNNINWYSVQTGGSYIGFSASGANYAVTPGSSGTYNYYAESQSLIQAPTQTFAESGSIVNWTVPAGVSSLTITADGAQGGSNGGTGGLGAIMTGTFSVTPGQVLSILAGQQPTGGSYAGGGGGSYVALGASYSSATPMIVAGGGGGCSSNSGSPFTGINASTSTSGNGPIPGTGGNGAASTSCGGGGGGFYTSGGSDNDAGGGNDASGGKGFQEGGAGGTVSGYASGGFGGGAPPNYHGGCNLVGGAGGGYSGGSGLNNGNNQNFGYGGGSYNGGTNQSNSVGNTGNGQVLINYLMPVCVSPTRTLVQVTVSPLPSAAGAITGSASVYQGQTGVTYSVPSITNATGYVWSLPTGATVTTGTNTDIITVSYSSSASSGNVTVYGTNSCGNGTVSTNYPVTVNALPSQYTTTLSNGTNAISASTQCISSAATVTIQTFNLVTAGNSGTNNPLTGISFPVSGAYLCSDLNYYQIWYNTTNSLSGASQFGSNISCPGTGVQTLSTTGSLTMTADATYYFFITMNVATSPTNGDYIIAGGLGTSNLTTGNILAGSTASAGQQSLYQSPEIPVSVTATPSSICLGAPSNLNATSGANSINWYTTPTGGTALGTSLSGSNLTVLPVTSGTLQYYAEAQSWNDISQTFTSNGTWTVPSGLTTATVYIWGGGGAGGGGNGGSATNGANGGGGGGGACTVNTLNGLTGGDQYTITVGSGGMAYTGAAGGDGGTSGVSGTLGTFTAAGGSGGTIGVNGAANGGVGGSTGTGTVYSGGNGSAGNGPSNIDGTGGGGAGISGAGISPSSSCGVTGYGGAGIYPGGNGGYNSTCGTTTSADGTAGSVPGGGGSGDNSYTGTNAGGAGGNGEIIITYTPTVCVSASRTLVDLTVSSSLAPAANTGYPQSICLNSSIQIGAAAVGSNTYIWSPSTGLSSSTVSNPIASPTVTTTYTLTETVPSTGCTNSNSVVITVLPLPTITASPSPATYCQGSSITLTASGGITYTWSPSTGLNSTTGSTVTITATPPASYTVSGTGNNSCVNTSTVTIINETPSNVSVTGGGTFCSSANATLTATGGTPGTIYWQGTTSGGTSTSTPSVTQTVTSAGTYYFNSVNNGCWGTQGSATVDINSSYSSLAPPTNVTATPSSFCLGITSYLNATSAGDSINWYTVPTGGTPIGMSNSGGNFAVTPANGGILNYYAETQSWGSLTQTINYSGSIVNWTVPASVTSINITAAGAQGGSNGGTGGLGAIISGTFSVTPGQVLSILVGQQPTGGSYAGGGGGTFVASGATYSTATPMIVAGGGGGCSSNSGAPFTGINASTGTSGNGPVPGTGGNGAASTSCGGGGGGFYTSGGSDNDAGGGNDASGGKGFQEGGAGGTVSGYASGGFGGGAPPNYHGGCNLVGGAGGGYSGGSGLNNGNNQNFGYGGGSYNGGTNQSNSVGNTGNGSVVISATYNICISPTRTPVTLTVSSSAAPAAYTGGPQTICSGSSVQIGGSPVGSDTYIWSPTTGLSSSTVSNPIASPTITTTYTLTESVPPGNCSNSNSVVVTVLTTPTVTVNPASATNCSANPLTLTASGASTYTWSPSTGLNTTTGASVIVTATSSTTYTVTGTASDGCPNTATVPVTVITTPAPVTVAGNGAFCGSSTTITASGGSPGTIYFEGTTNGGTSTSTPSVSQTITSTGIYYFNSDNNGCWGTQGSAPVAINPIPTAPTLVTATPSSLCLGAYTDLNATSSGDSINWYTVPTSGTLTGMSNSGANFEVVPVSGGTFDYYAESQTWTTFTQTFNYSGSIVNWTVPPGVTSINVTASGAQGGNSGGSSSGGLGAIMTGTFNVTPGQELSILVGQEPSGSGYPAGGGGTYVALGANYTSATPLIVAGGGGGCYTGAGSTYTGCNASATTTAYGDNPGINGSGGLSVGCGGGGGGFYTSGQSDSDFGSGYPSVGGQGFQEGGAGGTLSTYQTGGFGGGATANYHGACNLQGGSGGGYNGASGKNSGNGQAFGYGGGSYNGGTNQSNSVGNTGNGQVQISATYNLCVSSTRTPVEFTVSSMAPAANTGSPQTICSGLSTQIGATPVGSDTYSWSPSTGLSDPTIANPIANPTITTTYTLTETIPATGCSNNNSVVITVLTTPTITVTPPAATYCSAANLASFTASGASTYAWSPSSGLNTTTGANVTVTTTSSTTYTVTGTATDGCVSTTTVPVTVITTPSPVNVSWGGIVCGASTIVTASGGSPGIIYFEGTTNGGTSTSTPSTSQTLTATGTYYFNSDNNGCWGTQGSTMVAIEAVPPAPTPVTATPSSFCLGAYTNLNATSSGDSINWYTVPTSGTLTGMSNSGANFEVVPISGGTFDYYAESQTWTTFTQTFNYSGSIVNWTVPPGVTSINITAAGAQGGSSGGIGGLGAIMTGTFSVTPSQVLSILVGQQPTGGGYPAGGGGTFVASGANYSTATPLIVAGGGGGCNSGTGSSYTGCNASATTTAYGDIPGTGGNGAPSVGCGGGAGGFYTSGASDSDLGSGYPSIGGQGFQEGGAGGILSGYPSGGFGGGATANNHGSCNFHGGSGGGYNGASGLNSGAGQAYGFGGGSYNGGTNQSNSVGNTGNGQVQISATYNLCVSSSRTPVEFTVSSMAPAANTGSPQTICLGLSTQIGATPVGSDTYNWNPSTGLSDPTISNPIANPTVTTTYTLTEVIPSTGCSNNNSVVITVIPTPTITVTPALASICSGNSVSLTAGGASTYTWSPSAGLNTTTGATVTVTATSSTTYTVSGTAINGCVNTTTVPITVITTPAPVTVSGSGTFCGSSTNLSASGGSPGTIYWEGTTSGGTSVYTASSSQTITSSGTYYFNSYNNGCWGTQGSATVSVYPIPDAPTNVTVSPTSVCLGASADLNATSTGNTINWYTVPTNGSDIGISESGTNFTVTPLSGGILEYYAEAQSYAPAATQTFNYTGSIVNWTVPPGNTILTITAAGAQGGSNGGTGGLGAIMSGTFSVTPGQVLSILVGQQPNGGGNFAAGGGGTFVAFGADYTTASPLIVAGGGGGSNGGNGDNASTGTSGDGPVPGTNGNGAPSTACGGGGGGFYTSGGNDTEYGYGGGAGFQQGGAGGSGNGYQVGGFGGGAAADDIGYCNLHGGAGGGYSGGSGLTNGNGQSYGFGGGSYNGGTNQSNSVGNTGNGQVQILYEVPACVSLTRTEVDLTVNSVAPAANTGSPQTICSGLSTQIGAAPVGSNIYSWSPATGLSDPTVSNPIASPTITTTYTLIETIPSTECSNTNSVVITVISTPTVTVTPGSATYCSGNSVSLTASGASTYTWSPSSGLNTTTGATVTVTATSSINYTVSGTAIDGCVNTFTVPITVITTPAPVIVSGSGSYCGNSANITASGGSPGIIYWQGTTNGGTSAYTASASQTVTSSGSYYFNANNDGCWGTQGSATVYIYPVPAAPTGVTATPSSICLGASTALNATSAGNTINWYTVSSEGSNIGTSVSGVNFAVTPVSSGSYNYYAETQLWAPADTITFNYTGSIVNWTVPFGSTSITITSEGAQGSSNGGTGGLGAIMTGTFSVTPGQVLSILVGQQPTGGGSYAAGGGGTFVALGANYTTATPLVVAGGGGGCNGGTGSGLAGCNATTSSTGNGPDPGTNGNGAPSTTCGGGGGGFYSSGGNDNLYGFGGGAGFQEGGAGGSGNSYQPGGFGGGASADDIGSCNIHGGAGGGYSGGSGLNSGSGQSYGFGGGSFNGGTNQSNTVGNSGNGLVKINYYAPVCVSTSRVMVPVSVNTIPAPVTISGGSSFCGSGTLTAGGGSPGIIYWQGTTNAGTSTSTPATSETVTSSGTYYFNSSNGGCWGSQGSATVSVNPIPSVPSSVTATPGSICQGSTANLNATSEGNTINWYTLAVGGNDIGTSLSGNNFSVSPSAIGTTNYYAETQTWGAVQTFNYTGSITNWTVPEGITSITISASGAQGGSNTGTGGLGAVMTGTFTATPGQVLSILVGQQPTSGIYAGGGGGTFVALGANYATATPLIVAGGGGGAYSGAGGNASIGTSGTGPVPGTSGDGAVSTTCGGGGGGFYSSGGSDSPNGLSGGQGFRQGGAGGTYTAGGYQPGGFGGGASCDNYESCQMKAGAGGGYSGGSGLNSTSSLNSGYGGGSYNGGTNQNNYIGNFGNGQVQISYTAPLCVSTTRTLVAVNVNPQPTAPTLNVKTPNLSSVCAGQGVSATFYSGSGGVGCSDDYTVSIDGGAATAYSPGNTVGTSALSSIVIQGERAGCTSGAGCTGTGYHTLASWTIIPAPDANAGNNNSTTICSSGTYTVTNASVSNDASFSWSTSGNGTFSPNTTTLNPVYTPGSTDISTGSVILSLTATGNSPCGNATNTKTITVSNCGGTAGLWDGGYSGYPDDWNQPENWDDGELPSGSTSVTIPAHPTGGNFFPVINNDESCGNLTIKPGASVLINNPYTLTVNGNLLVASDATGCGCLAIHGNVNITGTATVQRFITGVSGYHYISSPIGSATLSQVNAVYPLVNSNFGYYNPNNPPPDADLPNMWWLDETHSDLSIESQNGWKGWSNLSQSMGNMLGWAFIVNSGVNIAITGEGDELYGANGANQPQYDAILTPAPGGYSGHGGNGFSLIGNPYPCTIDWDVVNVGNLDGAAYFWKPTSEYGGSYAYYVNGVSTGVFSVSNKINVMQGFMVHASDYGNNTLEFTNDIMTPDNSTLFKSNKSANYPLIKLSAYKALTTINDHRSNNSDGAIIYFNEYAQNGFNKHFDAYKLMNTDTIIPNLSVISDNLQPSAINYSIKAFDKITDDLVIPLGFSAHSAGQYIISANTIDNMPPGTYVYLFDMQTGNVQNLTLNPSYTFNAKGIENNRFFIKFTDNASGINNLSGLEMFNAYSNDNVVYVNYKNPAYVQASLSILDVTGQNIMDGVNIVNGSHHFNLDVAPGVYFVKLVTKAKVYVTKVYIH